MGEGRSIGKVKWFNEAKDYLRSHPDGEPRRRLAWIIKSTRAPLEHDFAHRSNIINFSPFTKSPLETAHNQELLKIDCI
jgi:hypothetical protein